MSLPVKTVWKSGPLNQAVGWGGGNEARCYGRWVLVISCVMVGKPIFDRSAIFYFDITINPPSFVILPSSQTGDKEVAGLASSRGCPVADRWLRPRTFPP